MMGLQLNILSMKASYTHVLYIYLILCFFTILNGQDKIGVVKLIYDYARACNIVRVFQAICLQVSEFLRTTFPIPYHLPLLCA